MKQYKKLCVFKNLVAFFFFVVVTISLSGCGLTEAFINVFNDDDDDNDFGDTYSYEGTEFNYGLTSDPSIFLQENIFLKNSTDVTDTIHIINDVAKVGYFFYFTDNFGQDPNYEKKEYYNVTFISSFEFIDYRYEEQYPTVSIYDSGADFIHIDTYQFPNHRSNYFFNSVLQASNVVCVDGDFIFCSNQGGQGGFSDRSRIVSPNLAVQYNFPVIAKVLTPTPLGDKDIIGLARNGVPLARKLPSTQEDYHDLKSRLDEYYGYPADSGYYYFAEPTFFTGYEDDRYFHGYEYTYFVDEKDSTKLVSRSDLIGIALDGFPIYGPIEYGIKGTVPDDLDTCRGHVGLTGDNFSNSYHYHIKPVEYIEDGEENLFIECFSGTIID
ncbi:MAG: hypothetical protein CMP21_06535 [Rickettsiales bacterium]|nr:hypothetical protein [Rickettsiales bacterium]|tara:strand:+ start:17341 stop:18486 length:1146 start_codon:yes stop_codon:yes gene_type:complete